MQSADSAVLILPSLAPLWEISSQVESLSLETRTDPDRLVAWDSDRRKLAKTDEVSEEDLILVEDDPHSHTTQLGAHYSLMYRTIASAARGGKLRRLMLPEFSIQKPFAVRALVPCWVNIEEWDLADVRDRPFSTPSKCWRDAASALRPALAHASFWLLETEASRKSRLMTYNDVQSLLALFTTEEGTPDFTGERQIYTAHFAWVRLSPDSPAHNVPAFGRSLVDLYLPWVVKDASLAQQVADAWNAVVERKEADKVKCRCAKCNALHSRVVKCRCRQCRQAEARPEST